MQEINSILFYENKTQKYDQAGHCTVCLTRPWGWNRNFFIPPHICWVDRYLPPRDNESIWSNQWPVHFIIAFIIRHGFWTWWTFKLSILWDARNGVIGWIRLSLGCSWILIYDYWRTPLECCHLVQTSIPQKLWHHCTVCFTCKTCALYLPYQFLVIQNPWIWF